MLKRYGFPAHWKHISEPSVEISNTKLEEMKSFGNIQKTIKYNYTRLPKSNVNKY